MLKFKTENFVLYTFSGQPLKMAVSKFGKIQEHQMFLKIICFVLPNIDPERNYMQKNRSKHYHFLFSFFLFLR